MESDESYHSQEPLPDFHITFTLQTLQDIAASKYAFISWCTSSDLDLDLPHIPSSIRSMIDDKIPPISKEIVKCRNNFQRLIGDISPEVILNCAAFNSAGGICCRTTVKNILASNLLGFDSMKQFEIACSYSIEEDVERLWPLVKDNEVFHQYRFDISSVPSRVTIMDYWCSRMRGELLEFYEPEGKSAEWYTVSELLSVYENVKTWTEIEYFWCKLNTQERKCLVDRIWKIRDSIKYDLIVKSITDTVLNNVIRTSWFLLIEHFALDDIYYQYALLLWNYGKSTTIFKDTTVYDILHRLSDAAPQCEYKYVTIVLKEIWLSAADHLKNYVCSGYFRVEKLFEKCLLNADIRSFAGRDYGFLIEVLKYASFDIRQQMWDNWWPRLTLANISDIRELMTLCFDNVNDIVRFKQIDLLNYQLERDFDDFVHSESLEKISEYLMFCYSDADENEKLVRITKTLIIVEQMSWIIGHDSDLTLSKFFKFFDDCFTLEEEGELLECHIPDKETGLLSLWISFSSFDTFDKILRYLKFSDQRLMELKGFFKERCRHVSTFGNFNSFSVDDWDKFLKWCGFSPEEVSEFRCNIQIDNMFEKFLLKMYMLLMTWKYRPRSLEAVCFRKIGFSSIDGFLLWYFGSEQAAKQYKLSKMDDGENCKVIEHFLEEEDYNTRAFFLFWINT
ncbi:uncharacterized protein LOC135843766 [Planococcus citri]|uniref:uncharacterized protein LOC135843766 n=1 Tax=Planococcus citri TaxID=170843 RepID=UPI0031F92030